MDLGWLLLPCPLLGEGERFGKIRSVSPTLPGRGRAESGNLGRRPVASFRQPPQTTPSFAPERSSGTRPRGPQTASQSRVSPGPAPAGHPGSPAGSGASPGSPCCQHRGVMRRQVCFWAVVLEKTLESPLDSKVNPVNPRGNQP